MFVDFHPHVAQSAHNLTNMHPYPPDNPLSSHLSLLQMMESSFTGMKYVKKDETSVHERIMEQYINEKLGGAQKKAPEGTCCVVFICVRMRGMCAGRQDSI